MDDEQLTTLIEQAKETNKYLAEIAANIDTQTVIATQREEDYRAALLAGVYPVRWWHRWTRR